MYIKYGSTIFDTGCVEMQRDRFLPPISFLFIIREQKRDRPDCLSHEINKIKYMTN